MREFKNCFSSECLQKLKIVLEENFITKNVLKDYSFYFISEKFDITHDHNIYTNLRESKVIMIKNFKEPNQDDIFFVILFNKTIIIIHHSIIQNLKHLFSTNPNISFYILSDSNEIPKSSNIPQNHPFDDMIQNFCGYLYIKRHPFDDVIIKFRRYLYIKRHPGQLINQLWAKICDCIACYFFQESYIKSIEKQNSIVEKFDCYQINKLRNHEKCHTCYAPISDQKPSNFIRFLAVFMVFY